MNDLISKIYKKVGVDSVRTKNITKHIFFSFIFKGGSILINFLIVPITINFLDTENYGIWLTLSSFIAWFSFFDVGLGNSLRNKFAEAKISGNTMLAKAYVSSAYFTIFFICILLILLFILSNIFIDWTIVFNTNSHLKTQLALLMPIVFTFFCLQLVLKLIATIYAANQEHSVPGKITFFTQLLSLISIWIATKTTESSLLTFGLIYSITPVILLITLNIYAFSDKFKEYKPTIKLWKKEYLKDIFNLGIKFFLIQMSAIILYTTDNVIISQLYSPKEVVPYTMTFQYFGILTMVITIIFTPYWSSFTEAFTKKDFDWIKKSITNLFKISLFFSVIALIMILFAKDFIFIWSNQKVLVPISLVIFMSIFVITQILVLPFTYYFNGTGKINFQLIIGLSGALINIPLSIFFAKILNLGFPGVILGTATCNSIGLILYPYYYKKIIQKDIHGEKI